MKKKTYPPFYYPIKDALELVTGDNTLRQTLADIVEEELGLEDEEGTMHIDTHGPNFRIVFVPADTL